MIIRSIRPEDAPAYRDLYLQLDKETDFRLYEAGERPPALEGFTEEIERFLSIPQSNIIVAEDEETGRLAGYLQAIGRTQKHIRHVVSINIALLQCYTGQGLGGKLFAYLEDWARTQGIRRLDLTVMENNPNAKKLYEKLGFQHEGVKKRSFLLNDTFIDEYYMAKWLE